MSTGESRARPSASSPASISEEGTGRPTAARAPRSSPSAAGRQTAPQFPWQYRRRAHRGGHHRAGCPDGDPPDSRGRTVSRPGAASSCSSHAARLTRPLTSAFMHQVSPAATGPLNRSPRLQARGSISLYTIAAGTRPFSRRSPGRRPPRRSRANPDRTGYRRLAAIARGDYDSYLRELRRRQWPATARDTARAWSSASATSLNGYWYTGATGMCTPSCIVTAWRHIVTVFRRGGRRRRDLAVDGQHHRPTQRHPSPAPWWPGSSYVTWVGIDGYYLKPSWTFASLFGPTIKAVRSADPDPILISETGAAPAAGQPAKISDLFAGVRSYGLLGFVWFDALGRPGLAPEQSCGDHRVWPRRRRMPVAAP